MIFLLQEVYDTLLSWSLSPVLICFIQKFYLTVPLGFSANLDKLSSILDVIERNNLQSVPKGRSRRTS